jgi:hypothetical protein
LITERDLEQAIAECQGERNPNANTCIKLAAFYTIRNVLFGNSDRLPVVSNNATGYSYAAAPVDTAETIHYDSGTDFSQAIDGRNPDEIWPIIDEAMSAIQVLMPRLYAKVMRDLQ